jgi:hypothetical protein
MANPELPLYFEPIVGRRCWGLAKTHGGSILLCSQADLAPWPSGRRFEATCHRNHTAPAPGCSCGLYALNEAQGWPYYNFDGKGHAVWGEVNLWGVVVKATRGYRAQYAYPKKLWLAHKDHRFVARLRESYPGVPITLRNPFPEIIEGR